MELTNSSESTKISGESVRARYHSSDNFSSDFRYIATIWHAMAQRRTSIAQRSVSSSKHALSLQIFGTMVGSKLSVRYERLPRASSWLAWRCSEDSVRILSACKFCCSDDEHGDFNVVIDLSPTTLWIQLESTLVGRYLVFSATISLKHSLSCKMHNC